MSAEIDIAIFQDMLRRSRRVIAETPEDACTVLGLLVGASEKLLKLATDDHVWAPGPIEWGGDAACSRCGVRRIRAPCVGEAPPPPVSRFVDAEPGDRFLPINVPQPTVPGSQTERGAVLRVVDGKEELLSAIRERDGRVRVRVARPLTHLLSRPQAPRCVRCGAADAREGEPCPGPVA